MIRLSTKCNRDGQQLTVSADNQVRKTREPGGQQKRPELKSDKCTLNGLLQEHRYELKEEHRYELKEYRRDGEYEGVLKKKRREGEEEEEEEAQRAGGSGRSLNGSLNLPPGSGLQGASGPGHPVVAAPVQIRTENSRDLSALHIRFPVKQPLHLPALIFSVSSLCPGTCVTAWLRPCAYPLPLRCP